MIRLVAYMHELLIAAGVQFGGHFAKNIAPLKLYFSDDPHWNISTTRWGMFQSAVTLPCVLFPWLLGQSIDRKRKTKSVLVAALVIVCVGELIFIMSTRDHWLTGCLLGRFVFGVGEGIVSSLSVFVAATSVPRFKMTAIGLTQAFHALAVACSKASLAVLAEMFDSYVGALIFSLLVCLVSLVIGIVWKPQRSELSIVSCDEGITPRSRICCRSSHARLPIDFWLVAGIHMTFSSAHRLFGHIDAPFLAEKFGHSTSIAGYASSITEFVAMIVSPPVGLFLDIFCTVYTLPRLLFASACLGGLAYLSLTSATVSVPIMEFALILIGVVNGITPTVMKSVIPETVHQSSLATAFGVYESSEAFGVVVGSVAVGAVADIFAGGYDNCVPFFSGLLFISTFMAGLLLIRREGITKEVDRGSVIDPFMPCAICQHQT